MEGIGRVSGVSAALAALKRLDQPTDPIESPGAFSAARTGQEVAIRVLKMANDASVSVLQLLDTGNRVDYRV